MQRVDEFDGFSSLGMSPGVRESDQRVPVLGRIPGLGALFRSRKTDKVKTNLLIFIRPKILRDSMQTSLETNAPMTARELHEACDLRKRGLTSAAAFDGPLAWRAAINLLNKGTGTRSKHDKEYYELASKVQVTERLPDTCTAEDYGRKAIAFIYLH